jgi:hypothetical protein
MRLCTNSELKIKDKNDPVRKWVYRNVTSLFGVPDYIAYRPKMLLSLMWYSSSDERDRTDKLHPTDIERLKGVLRGLDEG